MPKTASAGWLLALKADPSHLATCYRIERLDGQVLTLTTSVDDLVIADSAFTPFGLSYGSTSRTYQSVALAPSETREMIGVKPNTLNLQIPTDDDIISENDVWAGKYDYADVMVFTAEYTDLGLGPFDIWRGKIGSCQQAKQTVSLDINSLSTLAQQPIGRLTKETCRWKFGGTECGVNLNGNNPDAVPYRSTAVPVTSQGSNTKLIFRCSSLIGKPANFYQRGYVEWTTGDNTGTKMDILSFDTANGEFVLWDELAYSIDVADQGTFTAGCEKTYRACWENHDAITSFGGYAKHPTLETAGRVN